MKKKLILILVAFMSVALTGSGVCAETKGNAAKPIELIVAHAVPAQAPLGQACKQWGDMIEKNSGGRVKFIYYWSYTLMPPNEYMKGVMTGAADVIYMLSQISNYMPISYNIMYMPFMGYSSMQAGTQIYKDLYKKFPEIRQEFAKVKLLSTTLAPPAHLHMSEKKNVTAPSDMKGTKILLSSTAGKITDMVKSWGAAPVQVGPADFAMSLNTGVVDGWIDHFPCVNVFGCMPLVSHHTIFGNGGIAMALDALMMNLDTYNKLPPDIQKIVDEASTWYTEEVLKSNVSEIERAVGEAKKLGHTFTYLTPDQIRVWADTASKFHQDWITEMEAKGKPARAIYEEARKLIKQYEK